MTQSGQRVKGQGRHEEDPLSNYRDLGFQVRDSQICVFRAPEKFP